MLNHKKIKLINVAICVLSFSFLTAQDNEKNYVVTFTKSSLKPMAQVEDGSGTERKDLFSFLSSITSCRRDAVPNKCFPVQIDLDFHHPTAGQGT